MYICSCQRGASTSTTTQPSFFVACTRNGSISYVSPLYVGSISDVELTRICGFLTKPEDKPGISIMADRGFRVKDMLEKLTIRLNIPPFMEGLQQLPSEEIEAGRKIASLRIHIERAIGRIKTYRILTSTIPLSMARLSNQIVCICAFLSNFHPALIPQPPEVSFEANVDKYFEGLSDSENEVTSESDEDSDYHMSMCIIYVVLIRMNIFIYDLKFLTGRPRACIGLTISGRT